jgi:hypothetical protein
LAERLAFWRCNWVDCFEENLIEQNQVALFERLLSEWQRVLESKWGLKETADPTARDGFSAWVGSEKNI